MAKKKPQSDKWADRTIKRDHVDPESLLANPANAAIHTHAQQASISGALGEIGWLQDVVVNLRTSKEWPRGQRNVETMVDGHMRAMVAISSGQVTIPVKFVDLSPREEKLALATINPIALQVAHDKAALDSLLREVTTGDAGLQAMLGELAQKNGLYFGEEKGAGNGGDEFEASVEDGPTRTHLGELWAMADHRLLVADCTKPENVLRLFDGEQAVLMNTDPPYGVSYDVQNNYDAANEADGTHRVSPYAAIENDELTGEQLQAFLEQCIRSAVPCLIDNAAFYLWHPMLTQGTFFAAAAAAAADILIHRQIIWVKSHFIFGRGDYHWKHELCFYGWRRGHRPPFYGSRNQDTVWQLELDGLKAHPTQKPIELFIRPMANHSKEGEIVFDPFAGSGSQFIAAERLRRRCYGIEIEPRYADICLRRYEAETSRAPVLLERTESAAA